jgi:hypothetical protein
MVCIPPTTAGRPGSLSALTFAAEIKLAPSSPKAVPVTQSRFRRPSSVGPVAPSPSGSVNPELIAPIPHTFSTTPIASGPTESIQGRENRMEARLEANLEARLAMMVRDKFASTDGRLERIERGLEHLSFAGPPQAESSIDFSAQDTSTPVSTRHQRPQVLDESGGRRALSELSRHSSAISQHSFPSFGDQSFSPSTVSDSPAQTGRRPNFGR